MNIVRSIISMTILSLCVFMSFTPFSSKSYGYEISGCLLKEYRAGLVKIKTSFMNDDGETFEDKYGTGFFISDQGHIITAEHVVSPREHCDPNCRVKSITILVGENHDELKATVYKTTNDWDFIVLKVPNKAQPYPTLPTMTSSDEGKLVIGDAVIALGFPKGFDATVTPISIVTSPNAMVAGVNTLNVQTSLNLASGMSGGPVFDSTGKVVGISVETHREIPNVGYVLGLTNVIETYKNQVTTTSKANCTINKTAGAETIKNTFDTKFVTLEEKVGTLETDFKNHVSAVRKHFFWNLDIGDNFENHFPTSMKINVRQIVAGDPILDRVTVVASYIGIDLESTGKKIEQQDRERIKNLRVKDGILSLDKFVNYYQDRAEEDEFENVQILLIKFKIYPYVIHKNGEEEKLDDVILIANLVR